MRWLFDANRFIGHLPKIEPRPVGMWLPHRRSFSDAKPQVVPEARSPDMDVYVPTKVALEQLVPADAQKVGGRVR
jgi:hypothetical protein